MSRENVIGYVSATCVLCGERYNGYKHHTCPPLEHQALEAHEAAMIAWGKEHPDPRTKTERDIAATFNELVRAHNAAPYRRDHPTGRLASQLKMAGTKTGRIQCAKPNVSNRPSTVFVCDTTPRTVRKRKKRRGH